MSKIDRIRVKQRNRRVRMIDGDAALTDEEVITEIKARKPKQNWFRAKEKRVKRIGLRRVAGERQEMDN